MKLFSKPFPIIFGVFAAVVVAGIVFTIISPQTLGRASIIINGKTISAEVANTPSARAQGLSFRTALGFNNGMLFLFDKPDDYGFWMKDMNFPIDIVWIKDDKIVGVVEKAAPEPNKSIYELTIYYPPEAVDKVLEFPAGRARLLGASNGDVVSIKK